MLVVGAFDKEVGDIHATLLADAVSAILALKHCPWLVNHLDENHLIGGGERESYSCGGDLSVEDANLLIVLELVNNSLAELAIDFPRDGDTW